jgi:hypothetical protein
MELNISAASSSNKDGSGAMSDGNEARGNLQEKIAQARRLLHQSTDAETVKSLKAFIADLENRLRSLQ